MKFLLLAAVLSIAACTTQPSCRDTPRNMRCMSGDQLERALSGAPF